MARVSRNGTWLSELRRLRQLERIEDRWQGLGAGVDLLGQYLWSWRVNGFMRKKPPPLLMKAQSMRHPRFHCPTRLRSSTDSYVYAVDKNTAPESCALKSPSRLSRGTQAPPAQYKLDSFDDISICIS